MTDKKKRVIVCAIALGVMSVALASELTYIFGVLDPMFSTGKLSSDAYNARLYASGIVLFSVVAVTVLLAVRWLVSGRATVAARPRSVRTSFYWVLAACVLMITSSIAGSLWPRSDARLGLYAGILLAGLATGYVGFRGSDLSVASRRALLAVSAFCLLIAGSLLRYLR